MSGRSGVYLPGPVGFNETSTFCLRGVLLIPNTQTGSHKNTNAVLSVCRSLQGGCFGALGIWETSPSTTVFLCLCLPECFSGSLETNTMTSHCCWTLFVLQNAPIFPFHHFISFTLHPHDSVQKCPNLLPKCSLILILTTQQTFFF